VYRRVANDRRFKSIDDSEVVRLYVDERLSALEIGARLGASGPTIRARLLKAGVELRTLAEQRANYIARTPPKPKQPPAPRSPSRSELEREARYQRIVALYTDKRLSALAIAQRLGVGRAMVDTALRQHGVEKRPLSELQRIASSRRSPRARRAGAAAAQAARRGSCDSFESLFARAHTKERRAVPTAHEARVLAALVEDGYLPVAQLAVGKYNVDAGLPELMLAVEVDPGDWHRGGRKRIADLAKERYLAAVGWRVLRVDPSKDPVTWLKLLRSLPAPSRKHRMLWRRYQALVANGRYDELAAPWARAEAQHAT
jgi:very-short-patch-repair endonuclease